MIHHPTTPRRMATATLLARIKDDIAEIARRGGAQRRDLLAALRGEVEDLEIAIAGSPEIDIRAFEEHVTGGGPLA